VVITLLLLVVLVASFIYVIMARYAEVLERTQEIGIFRFLGASSAYIFNLLFQESLLIAISGTTVGIAMTYGTRWFMNHVLPGILTQDTVYEWWPIAGVISVVVDLLGAIVPSWKAVNQDVIQHYRINKRIPTEATDRVALTVWVLSLPKQRAFHMIPG
jgi:putative ABC transport system permease protein